MPSSALLLVASCGGRTSALPAGSATDACDAYYDAITAPPCAGPQEPPAEIERERARFDRVCTNALGLAGSGFTPSALESCASAIESLGCVPDTLPVACDFTGTLPGGEACASNDQCASGLCNAEPADGSAATIGCGTCAALLADGQACDPGDEGKDGVCGRGSACVDGSCSVVSPLAQGQECDIGGVTCASGLYCAASGTCATLLGMGDACMDDEACASPLVCVGGYGQETCQSLGATGATCASDSECAPGLACGGGYSCAAVTWATAGEPCGGTTLCLVGTCGTADGGTACPEVLSDGQPCDPANTAQTCDAWASCQAGTCEPYLSRACP